MQEKFPIGTKILVVEPLFYATALGIESIEKGEKGKITLALPEEGWYVVQFPDRLPLPMTLPKNGIVILLEEV